MAFLADETPRRETNVFALSTLTLADKGTMVGFSINPFVLDIEMFMCAMYRISL